MGILREGFNKKKQNKIWIYPYLGLTHLSTPPNRDKNKKKGMSFFYNRYCPHPDTPTHPNMDKSIFFLFIFWTLPFWIDYQYWRHCTRARTSEVWRPNCLCGCGRLWSGFSTSGRCPAWWISWKNQKLMLYIKYTYLNAQIYISYVLWLSVLSGLTTFHHHHHTTFDFWRRTQQQI